MLYIGIDPGVHTGFAVWDSSRKEFLQVCTLPIHQALRRVQLLASHEPTGEALVVFEDARLRTWFGGKGRNQLQGAGSIKRDCTIWQDFLEDSNIAYIAKKPSPGTTKWDSERFQAITGWKGRTSEHSRDAAILVYGR